MDATRQVLIEMSAKDVVSWNTIINGLAKAGEQGLAHKLFDIVCLRRMLSLGI
jgi:pentatricopeptide repeat protein